MEEQIDNPLGTLCYHHCDDMTSEHSETGIANPHASMITIYKASFNPPKNLGMGNK